MKGLTIEQRITSTEEGRTILNLHACFEYTDSQPSEEAYNSVLAAVANLFQRPATGAAPAKTGKALELKDGKGNKVDEADKKPVEDKKSDKAEKADKSEKAEKPAEDKKGKSETTAVKKDRAAGKEEVYDRNNDKHKAQFSTYLDETYPGWDSDDTIDAYGAASRKMAGVPFRDKDGEILESFKEAFKAEVDANQK
jgi:hypothetical protein